MQILIKYLFKLLIKRDKKGAITNMTGGVIPKKEKEIYKPPPLSSPPPK